MSEGSRDQLYLALRLAALELQIEQGLNMPLIADDLFINHLVPLAREVLGDELNVLTL